MGVQKQRRRPAPRPVPAPAAEGAEDGVTQLAVRVPSTLYRRIKIHSIATGDSMSKVTEDAYRTLLRERRA